jgi:hypothetical protein
MHLPFESLAASALSVVLMTLLVVTADVLPVTADAHEGRRSGPRRYLRCMAGPPRPVYVRRGAAAAPEAADSFWYISSMTSA